MRTAVWVILILALFGAAGYLIYTFTGSDTAAYIVSVVGGAVGLASLIVALRNRKQPTESTQTPNNSNFTQEVSGERNVVAGRDLSANNISTGDTTDDKPKDNRQ
jgi:hypothetical protein